MIKNVVYDFVIPFFIFELSTLFSLLADDVILCAKSEESVCGLLLAMFPKRN